MAILVDTNILVRAMDGQSSVHAAAARVLAPNISSAKQFRLCAQTLIEFWFVATRPLSVNGLGFSPGTAGVAVDRFLQVMPCLPEPPMIIEIWRAIVARYGVSGKVAHDARLVAFMEAHRIDTLLTLNMADFARYQTIRTLTPAQLLQLP